MKKRISVLALVALFATNVAMSADPVPSKNAAMWKELRERVEAQKAKLLEKAKSVASVLNAADAAVKALEESKENHDTADYKERLRVAKDTAKAADAASKDFNKKIEPLDALIDQYTAQEAGDTTKYSKDDAGATVDLDAQIDKLEALEDYNHIKFKALTADARLAGIERRLDRSLMGAYVREKITAALANTLCDKELCEKNPGGGLPLRRALEDKFDNLYFSDDGKPGRSPTGSKTHK